MNSYFVLRFAMASDLWLMEEGIADGYMLVVDMEGIVFGHLARLGLMTMKKFMFYLQVKFYNII